MAKIQEELVVIKLSRLHRDSQENLSEIAGAEVVAGLEAVVQELVGADVIVEVMQG